MTNGSSGEFSDSDMYDRMRDGWRMGAPETVCGNGSTLSSTRSAREWLPRIIRQYGIASLADAGAGDLAWIRHLPVGWVPLYRAFDLIPRDPSVTPWDITRDPLPHFDAILARMVLNHLQERIQQTVALLKQSGARYLIATQFDDSPSRTRQFQRLDLRVHFGGYLNWCADTDEAGCKLALWDLELCRTRDERRSC
jgi:hypothetical protein